MLTLDQALGANRPLIFVVAESDLEVLKHINEKYRDRDLQVYSTTMANMMPLPRVLSSGFSETAPRAMNTHDVLSGIAHQSFDKNNYRFFDYIFLDCQTYIHDQQHIRDIKDILSRYQLDDKFTVSLIFISQAVDVPPELQRLSEVVFFDLPNDEILENLLHGGKSEGDKGLIKKLELEKKVSSEELEEIQNNIKGLTLYEVEQAFLQCYHIHKTVNIKFIRDFKKNSIAKTNLLSLLESNVTFDQIGGMERLKEWTRKSKGGWTVEGKKFGLPLLKGVLLVGLPGCGKSLYMKAIGNEFGLPVISFDPSRIFSSRVGDSESNMRRVLQIVENMAPCLTGDTRITLYGGQVASLKELFDNKYRGDVLSIDSGFNIDRSKVVMITKKISSDLYNVRTTIGNVKATGNHKFPILKSDGDLYWVPVEDIQKGDFIVCPRQIETDKKSVPFDYLDDNTKIYSPRLCDLLLRVAKEKDYAYYIKIGPRVRGSGTSKRKMGKIPYGKGRFGFVFKHELIKFGIDASDLSDVKKISRGGGGFKDSFVVKFPQVFSKEFFYVLGLLWSDGNIGDKGYWYYEEALKSSQAREKYRQRNDNSTRFYGNEMALHKKVTDFLKREFELDLITYKSKRSKMFITPSISLIVSELFRRVQKDILCLPEEYQWSWLSGVLDGDGHIHKQRVNYSAVKHMNNEYIRDVFLRVGLISSSTKDDFKNLNVELTSEKFISRFHANTELCYPKKIDALCTLDDLGKQKKCRLDTLDVREKLIKILLSKNAVTIDPITDHDKIRDQSVLLGSFPAGVKKCFHEYLERKRYLDIDKIKNLFENIGESDQWFLNGNFFFSRVEGVDKIHGMHDVYDLCLDKNHNFIANRMFTHNCILSIDEIEKGLAGMQSSTFSDSGVTARVIGSFLVWLQDCTKPVFTVATANAIQYLPPELISRFDETFFVNLPQEEERQDIFRIHLQAINRNPSKFDLIALSQNSKDLSGREIEQALRESMYDAFYQKMDLTTGIILNALSKKTNLLTTMAEQLKYLLEWVGFSEEKSDGIRARFASAPNSLDHNRVQTEINDLLKDLDKKKPFSG